jgi:putative transposase
LKDAFGRYGVPAIFNTDQGSQFTSYGFIKELKDRKVHISMNGKAGGATTSMSNGCGKA